MSTMEASFRMMPRMHPSLQLAGAAALVAVLFYVVRIIVAGLFNPRAHLPGPGYARFTTIPLLWNRLRGRRHLWAVELHRRYGPVVLVAPDQVAVEDHESFTQVHRVGAPFIKTAFQQKLRFGHELSLFSLADVKVHAERRRLFSRAFSLSSLRQNWETDIRAKVDLAVAQIKTDAGKGSADTYKWWRLMTSDVIAQLSFGESFHMLESGQKSPYFVALENAGLNILLKDTMPFLMPLLKWLPLQLIRELSRADDIIYRQGSVAVQNLRSNESSRRNLFSNMIEQADSQDKLNLTDDTVREEAAMFMVAGSDTTAVSLTYLVWAILKRPQLQQRIEDEVATLQPGFRDVDVASLPLLNSVIEETLRLYNPAAGPNYRLVPQEGATFHGHYLPRETIVATHGWLLHRDEAFFPDPERFDETRFTNATAQVKAANVPFGIGSRSCLAPTLAKMELRLAAAVFFRQCRGATLAPDMTDDDMTQRILFFVFPKGRKCNIVLNTKE